MKRKIDRTRVLFIQRNALKTLKHLDKKETNRSNDIIKIVDGNNENR